jgi:hypothetical protein
MPKENTMLTTEQIRVLNDARTILRDTKPPTTWEGGTARVRYDVAENAIFQALNATRAYLHQPISDDLMHNREDDVTRSLGRADFVTIESDEDGFELHISTDTGYSYVVNVHGVSQLLLAEVQKEIGSYWEEARAAAADHQRDLDKVFACDPDESGGYDPSDPKHPAYHSTHADIWDAREGK